MTMATIKSHTDLPQSKVLAEFLPLESADMCFKCLDEDPYDIVCKPYSEWKEEYKGLLINGDADVIPCWSLAALSEFILPYIADNDGNNYKFYLSKDGLDRWIAYYKSDDVSIHICEESDNMIDVIFEMVCWIKNEEYI